MYSDGMRKLYSDGSYIKYKRISAYKRQMDKLSGYFLRSNSQKEREQIVKTMTLLRDNLLLDIEKMESSNPQQINDSE